MNRKSKISITAKVGNKVTPEEEKNNVGIVSMIDPPNSSGALLGKIISKNDNIFCDRLDFSEYEKVLPACIIALTLLDRCIQMEKGHENLCAQRLDIIGQKDRLLWKDAILKTYGKFFPSLPVHVKDDGSIITILTSLEKIPTTVKVRNNDGIISVPFDGCNVVEELLQTDVWQSKRIVIDLPEECWGATEHLLYDDVESLLDALTATNRAVEILLIGFKPEFQQKCMFHHSWSGVVIVQKVGYSSEIDRCIFAVRKLEIPNLSSFEDEIKSSDE